MEFLLMVFLQLIYCNALLKRSIDLASIHSATTENNLPGGIVPSNYLLDLEPNIENNTFRGQIEIHLKWLENAKEIALHSHPDLNINEKSITLIKTNSSLTSSCNTINIKRVLRNAKKMILTIQLIEEVKQGVEAYLKLSFNGYIWENSEGLFKGSYVNKRTGTKDYYLATYMRPNYARRLFPCFDEPGYKVKFSVSISRPTNYTTLFNTLIKSTEPMLDGNIVKDYFETTPPMSTFTFGFITANFQNYSENIPVLGPTISVWTTDYLLKEVGETLKKLFNIKGFLEEYFNATLPIRKIDFVAVPNFSFVKPADNWGLIVLRDTQLFNKQYYVVCLELIYQWIGIWVTPASWDDAHFNKALASFLAVETAIYLNNGEEFGEKYPMTHLYSLYYELSKRYPHSRITSMKKETISFKNELIIRMINFTIGRDTFQKAVQKFLNNHEFGTFSQNEFWDCLSLYAIKSNKINSDYKLATIAESWFKKDRLPMIEVNRDYDNGSAKIVQKLYLRERPHDVPGQEKMFWWIPLFIVRQTNLSFYNIRPYIWMENKKELLINKFADINEFVIINPEEIGPFPVNYDSQNWNYISQFLQTPEGRQSIPKLTRAKLLHDAWNLAFAGDLNFGIALNMTLFMEYETDHVVWNPIFTFIDQIGRHIALSSVHEKFEAYVLKLLTPIYLELGIEKGHEADWKTELRSLTKTFLCKAGYDRCVKDSQTLYHEWMLSGNQNTSIPISKEALCTVFKWGTIEEWAFGLERIICFPNDGVKSERTILLKALAECPMQQDKVLRLLHLSIIEGNSNFTDNDISLIFNMLTRSATGYTSLFTFLTKNFQFLKEKFINNTSLWNTLIVSATANFITEDGYNLVKKFRSMHSGEFGTAEHLIENSIKNIKDEAKWSSENLPVIEEWLDDFLKV